MSKSNANIKQHIEMVRARLNEPDSWTEFDERGLITILEHGLMVYGFTNDEDLVLTLVPLYNLVLQKCDKTLRYKCYRAIEQLAEQGAISLNAFMPFLLNETDRGIVSTATIDYAMINWSGAEEPLAAVRQLVDFVGEEMAENRGAIFGGLVSLGDRRVNELLCPLMERLTPDEVQTAALATTGFPSIASVEFWLDSLECLPGDANDPFYGHVAAALCLLADNAQVGFFLDAERNFGYLHRGEDAPNLKKRTFTHEEVAARLGDRFRALAAVEGEPALMPTVMQRYGIVAQSRLRAV